MCTVAVPVQSIRGLGASDRRLLLLYHSVDDRLRRLRSRDQPRLVALAEERRVRPVPRVWSGAHRHVLQPNAGGGAKQVPPTRSPPRPHQLDDRSLYMRLLKHSNS